MQKYIFHLDSNIIHDKGFVIDMLTTGRVILSEGGDFGAVVPPEDGGGSMYDYDYSAGGPGGGSARGSGSGRFMASKAINQEPRYQRQLR